MVQKGNFTPVFVSIQRIILLNAVNERVSPAIEHDQAPMAALNPAMTVWPFSVQIWVFMVLKWQRNGNKVFELPQEGRADGHRAGILKIPVQIPDTVSADSGQSLVPRDFAFDCGGPKMIVSRVGQARIGELILGCPAAFDAVLDHNLIEHARIRLDTGFKVGATNPAGLIVRGKVGNAANGNRFNILH